MCVCNEGTSGNPYEECVHKQHKCTPNSCGRGAQCQNGPRNIECACPAGYLGNPYVQCQDINECNENACGQNSLCINTLGSYDCKCKDGYSGNPFVVCLRVQKAQCEDPSVCKCGLDAPCPSGFVCKNQKCENTCENIICGPRAVCESGKCLCPEGFSGNAADLIKGCTIKEQCFYDGDCNSAEICFQIAKGFRKCVDTCSKIQCGPNALCVGQNHRSVCICADGYNGNPSDLNIGCQPEQKLIDHIPGSCNVDTDCNKGHACVLLENGQKSCLSVCQKVVCSQNEICHVDKNGYPVCQCEQGYIWNPVASICDKPSTPDCIKDNDCSRSAACKPDPLGVLKCAHVCSEYTCPENSECISANHIGKCQCLSGFTGNPEDRNGCVPISKNQCSTDSQCPESDVCKSDKGVLKCLPACKFTACGPQAICVTNNHAARCQCPPGSYAGDPNDLTNGCKLVPCVYNIDCPPNQLCNRLTHSCYDVCDEDSCGENAVCIAENQKTICQCPPGYRPNPIPDVECVATEICNPSPCHATAICEAAPTGYICKCPAGQIGDPVVEGCRPEGNCPNGDRDCPSQSICQSGKCINPCISACNGNANCIVENRKPICSCPLRFQLDVDGKSCIRTISTCKSDLDCTGAACINGQCQSVCRSNNDCSPNEKCIQSVCTTSCVSNSQCLDKQACVNGMCLIGCRSNKNCESNEACINSKCQNPCENGAVCGPNALCDCIDHSTICKCPAGFEGNPIPEQGCIRIPSGCKTTSQCPSGHMCIGNRCNVPCTENSVCAIGERCANNMCAKVCYGNNNCLQGEICVDGTCISGCNADLDCQQNQICLNSQCKCTQGFLDTYEGCQDVNECLKNPCHPSAKCQNIPGSFHCICPDGTVGDPFIQGCLSPGQCSSNADCAENLSCFKNQCSDPCNTLKCAQNAICSVSDHFGSCSCIPGHLGDPLDLNLGCFKVECINDDECPLNKYCNGQTNRCSEPCERMACGKGVCEVQQHRATCICNPGFVLIETKCVDIDECLSNPCHLSAICKNLIGSYACQCKQGTISDPKTGGCRKPGDCFVDSDCPDSAICENNRCKNPCELSRACGKNANCIAEGHRAVCTCPLRTIGDANNECIQLECVEDADCSSKKACINNQCQNPCSLEKVCGEKANCAIENHVAICSCQAGTTGNPLLGCVSLQYCSSNSQCSSGTSCSNGLCTCENSTYFLYIYIYIFLKIQIFSHYFFYFSSMYKCKRMH